MALLLAGLATISSASGTASMCDTTTKTMGEPLAYSGVALFLGVLAKTQTCHCSSPDNLVEHYDPDAFSELLDFPEAMAALHAQDSNATLEALLGVVKEHGMQGSVSVTANHRHFEMDPTEILVEQAVGNSSTTAVSKRDALPMTSLVPYMWVLRKGRFQPVEFMSKPSAKARANFETVQRSASFLKDFATVLRQHKASRLYGITISHRQHMPDGATTETSDIATRTLWTKPSDGGMYAGGTGCTHATVAWQRLSDGPGDNECSH